MNLFHSCKHHINNRQLTYSGIVLKDLIIVNESTPDSIFIENEKLLNEPKFQLLNSILAEFNNAQSLSWDIEKVPHLYRLLKALPALEPDLE